MAIVNIVPVLMALKLPPFDGGQREHDRHKREAEESNRQEETDRRRRKKGK